MGGACDYLSMLGLKLNHVSKRGHRSQRIWVNKSHGSNRNWWYTPNKTVYIFHGLYSVTEWSDFLWYHKICPFGRQLYSIRPEGIGGNSTKKVLLGCCCCSHLLVWAVSHVCLLSHGLNIPANGLNFSMDATETHVGENLYPFLYSMFDL